MATCLRPLQAIRKKIKNTCTFKNHNSILWSRLGGEFTAAYTESLKSPCMPFVLSGSRNLFTYIRVDGTFMSSSSVTSPNRSVSLFDDDLAQRVGNSALYYYSPENRLPPLQTMVFCSPEAVERLNPRHRAALTVIIMYAMRSAEYLRLTVADLCGNDRVLVHGAKGSGSYFVHLPGVDAQTAGFRNLTPSRSLAGTTYIELYKACKRAMIGERFSGKHNVTRTHIGRQSLVRQLVGTRSRSELSDLLRHKSDKSITYYGAERP